MVAPEILIFNLTGQRIPSKKVLKDIVRYALKLLKKNQGLSLVFIDNRLSRKLNYYWRKKNKPTTVLSFGPDRRLPFKEPYLGDIFINFGLIKKEAQKLNIPYLKYLSRFIIHGLIHLAGFDHQTKKANQKFIELENKIYQSVVNKIL